MLHQVKLFFQRKVLRGSSRVGTNSCSRFTSKRSTEILSFKDATDVLIIINRHLGTIYQGYHQPIIINGCLSGSIQHSNKTFGQIIPPRLWQILNERLSVGYFQLTDHGWGFSLEWTVGGNQKRGRESVCVCV